MTIDREKLKALAKAAQAWPGEVGECRWYEADCFKQPYFGIPDAEFMAAASPVAVLGLLAEIERLEDHKRELIQLRETHGFDCWAAALVEIDRLKGLRPEGPPRPPTGEGLPRYGLRWNGPQQPLAVPIDDGYWTPWHLAERVGVKLEVSQDTLATIRGCLRSAEEDIDKLKAENEALRHDCQVANSVVLTEKKDADRYRWLRYAENDVAILFGGHAWEDLSSEYMDQAIDAAMAKEGS